MEKATQILVLELTQYIQDQGTWQQISLQIAMKQMSIARLKSITNF